MQEKKNPALLPETDAQVLIARLRARSLAEGETEGNSLYRDSANALEVAASERDAALVVIKQLRHLALDAYGALVNEDPNTVGHFLRTLVAATA